MKITICIGSSCHLKGSQQIVEHLKALVTEKNLEGSVELSGAFCMNNCVNGVSIKIDEKLFSLKPEDVREFFENEVMSRLK